MTYLLPILSVVFGFLFVAVFKPRKQKNNLKLLLAFSGAFLLGTTIFEFLPEIYTSTSHAKRVSIFIVIGIFIQICLEFLSKGAEHGHVHISKENTAFPISIFISLSMHSILEGTPLHEHDSVLLGVFIHKIPIAIILTAFFFKSAISKVNILLFMILFALMTPLGSFLTTILPISSDQFTYISAITIGMFLHISTTILFESTEGHKFNFAKLTIIIIGLLSSYFV